MQEDGIEQKGAQRLPLHLSPGLALEAALLMPAAAALALEPLRASRHAQMIARSFPPHAHSPLVHSLSPHSLFKPPCPKGKHSAGMLSVKGVHTEWSHPMSCCLPQGSLPERRTKLMLNGVSSKQIYQKTFVDGANSTTSSHTPWSGDVDAPSAPGRLLRTLRGGPSQHLQNAAFRSLR